MDYNLYFHLGNVHENINKMKLKNVEIVIWIVFRFFDMFFFHFIGIKKIYIKINNNDNNKNEDVEKNGKLIERKKDIHHINYFYEIKCKKKQNDHPNDNNKEYIIIVIIKKK